MVFPGNDDDAQLEMPAEVRARDFAVPLTQTVAGAAVSPSSSAVAAAAAVRPSLQTSFEDEVDTGFHSGLEFPRSQGITRSDTAIPQGRDATPFSPIRRRMTRANTFKSIDDFGEFETHRDGWQPGAEPGLDPYKSDGAHASLKPSTRCDITIVDFSHNDIDVQTFTNDTLDPFLRRPQPEWSKCRWINVNGLSWDVISILGKHKKLHRLALEDVLQTRNRTKTDWYANHAFLIFTMLKLVRVCEEDSSDEDSDSDSDAGSLSNASSKNKHTSFIQSLRTKLRKMGGSRAPQRRAEALEKGAEPQDLQHLKSYETGLSQASGETLERTLQRYQAGPNEARIAYFEKHSALVARKLGVIAEQVSIFITNDNTIISFFELSADVVETPMLKRLHTQDTALRASCDASMVGQAIIDAAIDMAIPISSVYADVLSDLELDVLTRPNVTNTKKLYIIINEINKMLAFINPVINLINTLRDHKAELPQESAAQQLRDPSRGVIITPMTHTYLGDVLDHCMLITEQLNDIKTQADGLIDLIFNTISAYQNESMKQLTLATIFFLPLTFLTGYFGQNFQPFADLDRGVTFFWMIAVPMSFATVLVLMREMIWEWLKSFLQRRDILRARKTRHAKRRKRNN